MQDIDRNAIITESNARQAAINENLLRIQPEHLSEPRIPGREEEAGGHAEVFFERSNPICLPNGAVYVGGWLNGMRQGGGT